MLHDNIRGILESAHQNKSSVLLHGVDAPFVLRAIHPLKSIDLSELPWRQAVEHVLMASDSETLIVDRLDALAHTRDVKEALLHRLREGFPVVASATSLYVVQRWFSGALYLKFDRVEQVTKGKS